MREWGIKLRLYWCPNCNVPLRQRTCQRCGGEGLELRIGEPGDLRPAFEGDLRLFREGIVNEFGTESLLKDLMLDVGTTYLNKIPHVDDMKEVIVGGTVVGRLHFDPIEMKWRWRLSRFSAVVAYEKGLVKGFKLSKVRPLEVLGEGGREGEQAVVLNSSGDVVALAVVRKGRFRIQSIFKEGLQEPFKVRTSFLEFIKANDLWFRSKISRAVKHASIMYEKTKLPLVVSYSGGKDSLAVLDVVLRAGLEPTMLFNDTGLELPETIENVENVAATYGLKLLIAKPERSFWEAVEVFGPPAKDYRWCCKVVKLAPIAKVFKSLYPQGVLSVVGQRAFESIDRSWSGGVWRNKWLPEVLSISPIQDWDQLTLWAYIMDRKLPVNKLYYEGFERLGCYLCPAANVAEYHEISRKHPELWMAWEKFLKTWCGRVGLSDHCVKYHIWRWHNPQAQGRKRVEGWLRLRNDLTWREEYVRRSGFKVDLISGDKLSDRVIVKVEPHINLKSVVDQWKVVGKAIAVHEDKVKLRLQYGEASIKKESIEVYSHNAFEDAVTLLKLVVRWFTCVKCGNCVTWCPQKAITISEGKPKVNDRTCKGCGICINVCPISEVLVEKNLVTQLLGNPRSRPRKKDSLTSILHALTKKKETKVSNEGTQPAYEGIDEFLRGTYISKTDTGLETVRKGIS